MKSQQITKANGSFLTKFVERFPLLNIKSGGLILGLIVVSNVFTHLFFSPKWEAEKAGKKDRLYLLDRADAFISDTEAFEKKVRETSERLGIPPEWLMSVMYSESRLDASAENRKGSGAVGLIQFMPTTAKELNTSTARIKEMNHVEQMEYVFRYLYDVKMKYGEYNSLTELYLAILFPKALNGDQCFTLYANPSVQYKQNAGLDEDKDGRVTISDIDRRMQRIYPTAYMKSNAAPILAEGDEGEIK